MKELRSSEMKADKDLIQNIQDFKENVSVSRISKYHPTDEIITTLLKRII